MHTARRETQGAEPTASPVGRKQGRLSVEVVRGIEAADRFDLHWDALVLRQRTPNPTLSSIWQRHYLTLERATPCVVTVSDGPTLVAAGAFAVKQPLGRRGPRIARWLGPGRLLNEPDVIATGDRAAQRALMEAVLDTAHGVYLGKAPLQGSAISALRVLTPWLHEERTDDAWMITLPSKVSERLARKARFAERQAERRGSRVRVEIAREPASVREALERLFDLYVERWRGRPGELGRFAVDPTQRAWYRGVLAETAEHGGARIVEVFENDLLVSSLLGLLAGRGALFHSTATRGGGKLWGPGHRAMLEWIEEAHRSGATRMDLGRGSVDQGSPKARLRPTPVPFGRVIVASSARAQQGVVTACLAAAFARDSRRRLVQIRR